MTIEINSQERALLLKLFRTNSTDLQEQTASLLYLGDMEDPDDCEAFRLMKKESAITANLIKRLEEE